jgi:hypothetical protein
MCGFPDYITVLPHKFLSANPVSGGRPMQPFQRVQKKSQRVSIPEYDVHAISN